MFMLIDESALSKSAAIRDVTCEHAKFNRSKNSQDEHREFLAEHRIWKRNVKSLEKQLDKLDVKPDPKIDRLAIEAAYKNALMMEPVENKSAANFILKDTSGPMLAKRLGEGASSTGIINDDASGILPFIFSWAGNFCAMWSGADLIFDRTTGSSYQESPRVSVVLGLTPEDWTSAMRKSAERFARNGLGARMNVIHVPTLVKGERENPVPGPLSDLSKEMVERYNRTIKNPLGQYETKLRTNDMVRQIMTFSTDANAQAVLSERRVNELCKSGEFFSCVRERARRFYEHWPVPELKDTTLS